MLTQAQLIDAARIAQGDCSHYKIGKLLGITQAYMSRLRSSENIVSPAMALKLAHLAKLDPGYVLASIEHERAERTDTSGELAGVWEKIAAAMKQSAAGLGVLALLLVGGFSNPAGAYARDTSARGYDDLYIMRTRRRKKAPRP